MTWRCCELAVFPVSPFPKPRLKALWLRVFDREVIMRIVRSRKKQTSHTRTHSHTGRQRPTNGPQQVCILMYVSYSYGLFLWLFLCIIMYSYVLLCILMYSYVFLCLLMYSYVFLCILMYSYIILYMLLCLLMSSSVFFCLLMSSYVFFSQKC